MVLGGNSIIKERKMKLAEAKGIIRKAAGFRVEFEVLKDAVLRSDHFPDNDEDAIPTEEEAWDLARKFAVAGKDAGIVNVYIIHGDDFTPVDGYQQKELNIYPVAAGAF